VAKVVIRTISDWDSLNPALINTGAGHQVASALYDRLLAVNSDGKLIPYLATSWTVAPGSINFTLRTDAKCSDGTALTSEAVAASIQRWLDPQTKSPRRSYFGPATTVITASAPTSSTVKVQLSTMFGDLLPVFSDPASGIVCPGGLAPGADLEHNSFGSGPYTLTSVTRGDSATMRLRPEWEWGPRGTKAADLPTEIVARVVSSDTTAANLLQTGGLDVAIVNGPDVQRLENDRSLIQTVVQTPLAQDLFFNQSPGRVTADPAIRHAISTAIDRRAYNQAAANGKGGIASSFMGKTVECFDPQTEKLIPTPSVSDAKNILVGAGYTADSNGKLSKGGVPLAVRIVGLVTQSAGPDYIQAQLSAVGMKAELAKTDNTPYIRDLQTGNFDVAIAGVTTPVPSSNVIVPLIFNFGRITGGEETTALKLAQSTAGSERCKNLSDLQQSLIRNHDLLPLITTPGNYFSKGVNISPAVSFLDVTTIRTAG
jgi:peptide/nickel transport system substrate-binding protein